MDKNLGILLFGNEMIFNPQKIEYQIIPEVKPVSERVVNVVPALNVVKKIETSVSNKIFIITETFLEEEADLLNNILKACSLDIGLIEFIDYSKDKSKITDDIFGAQNTIISFGIGPQKMNSKLVLVPYQIKVLDNYRILLSDSLKVLSTNTSLKKNLWMALQKLLSTK